MTFRDAGAFVAFIIGLLFFVTGLYWSYMYFVHAMGPYALQNLLTAVIIGSVFYVIGAKIKQPAEPAT